MELPVAKIKKGGKIIGRNDRTKDPKPYYQPRELDLDNIELPKSTLIKPDKVKEENSNTQDNNEVVIAKEDIEVKNNIEDIIKVDLNNINDMELCSVLSCLADAGKLSQSIAACKITGIIRIKYIEYLKDRNNSFTIDDLRYLDSIIFNTVEEIVKDIIKYGKSEYYNYLIIDTIIKQSSLMDYEFDDEFYTNIKDILNQI